MHMIYGQAEGNGREALRRYTERFPMRRAPNHRFFAQLHLNLRESGSFIVSQIFLFRAVPHFIRVSKIIYNAVEMNELNVQFSYLIALVLPT